MNNVIQVLTTTADKPSAQAIAGDLVRNRLAACVQIDGPITSVYHWLGKLETADEWRCCIKSVKHLFPQIEDRIRQLHPYDEPEIIVTKVTGGSQSYLAWLRSQLADLPDAT